ncbi:MAG: hypothetical protein HY092_00820 [Candidatus Kerfeldbacteria bacterium]|nr:hypothetical protein [Candidatus Kerfeldbacteria bacterium]
MKQSPNKGFRLAAHLQGLPEDIFATAEDLFRSTKCVEFVPLRGKKHPGIMIILDRKFSLWFFREDDHFTYDGFEIGDYSEWPERQQLVFDKIK